MAAAIKFGGIDAAAGHLHVSPYVVSQCIKVLEQRVGQVRVLRENPSELTYFESDVDLEP